MTRTDDQVRVDVALREAVEDWLEAYGTAGTLTDFIMIGAVEGIDEDGDHHCATFVSHAEAFMPHWRMLGLLASAQDYLTNRMGDEGE